MHRAAARSFALLLALLAPTALADVDGRYAPDAVEPGSAEAIAELTSDPAFVNPWVAYLPDSEAVPSPTEFLGYIPGTAGELTRSETIYGYMRELARTSPRVEVEVLGETEEGREILLVVIADDHGIENLAALKAATARLADPRETDPIEAERVLAGARPIYVDPENPDEAVTESYLGVPILAGSEVIGKIAVHSYRQHAYTGDDLRLLSTIAASMGVAL